MEASQDEHHNEALLNSLPDLLSHLKIEDNTEQKKEVGAEAVNSTMKIDLINGIADKHCGKNPFRLNRSIVFPTAPADHRRTWDKEEYEKLAEKRKRKEDKESDEDEEDGDSPKKRELLKQREYRVDLDSRLGKSVVLTKNTPTSESGYYCNVCDCVVKDSINFLDHINGKKHQRNLGMSMKIERSSLEQVQKRFAFMKQKKNEQKKKYDLEKRLKELEDEEERSKVSRRDRRLARKRKQMEEAAEAEPEAPPVDPEMAAMMGFSGFASKNQN